MQTIVFIAGLDHSGSTMLDLLLGGHSKIVGLGEIALFLERYPESTNETCTCRKRATECPFWEKVILKLQTHDTIPLKKGYNVILNVFEELYGSDILLIDSSKYFNVLENINTLPNAEIRVLHLLKDVRNFSISRIDRAREKKKLYLRPFFTYRQFLSWYRNNKKVKTFLRDNNVESMQIGYEEICLYPIKTISAICDFLNLSFENQMLNMLNSTSHCVLGNRMRLQNEKKNIVYDSRWFIRKEWMIPSLILSEIMQFNSNNVYSQKNFQLYQR